MSPPPPPAHTPLEEEFGGGGSVSLGGHEVQAQQEAVRSLFYKQKFRLVLQVGD